MSVHGALNRLRSYWSPLTEGGLYATLLLVLCIRFLAGSAEYYPLERWDEANYLHFGVTGGFTAIWSPLYSAFLGLLQLFTRDAVETFHLNIRVQTSVLALLVFGVASRMGVRKPVSFLAGALILLSPFNALEFPKVNHFNASCYLCALLLSSLISDGLVALGVLTLFSLVSIYLRPENIVVFFLLLAWFGGLSYRRKRQKPFQALLLFSLLSLGMAGWLGSPFATARSFPAFSDHYFWRHGSSSGLPRDAFIQGVFGTADTVFRAAAANPKAFFGHLMENLADVSYKFPIWISYHFPFSRRTFEGLGEAVRASKMESVLILLGLLVGRAFQRFHAPSPSAEIWRFPWRSTDFSSRVYMLCLCFLCKSLASILVYSASVRYGLEFCVLFLISAAALLGPRPGSMGKDSPAFLLAPLLFLFFCTDHTRLPISAESFRPEQQNTSILGVVRYIRSLENKERRFRMFSEPCFAIYSGHPDFQSWGDFERVRSQYAGLGEYLDSNRTDLVVVDELMAREYVKWGGGREINGELGRGGFKLATKVGPATLVYVREGPGARPAGSPSSSGAQLTIGDR